MSHFVVSVIHKPDQDIDELLAPYMENCCGTPDYKYLEFYEDEEYEVDPVMGKRGYWQNPNAKWDWYQIGGRWSGYFEHNGKEYNTIPVDWYPEGIDQKRYDNAIADYNKWKSGVASEEELPFELAFFKREYIEEKYPTAEFYAMIRAANWERAVVTPDGQWHEVGEMGWFACSDETGQETYDWAVNFEKNFIAQYRNKGYVITAVDCHI